MIEHKGREHLLNCLNDLYFAECLDELTFNTIEAKILEVTEDL